MSGLAFLNKRFAHRCFTRAQLELIWKADQQLKESAENRHKLCRTDIVHPEHVAGFIKITDADAARAEARRGQSDPTC